MAYARRGQCRDQGPARGRADLVQIDEPYMQARPEAAREYGLAALDAALDGVTRFDRRPHLLRYAAIIHDRPEVSFLSAGRMLGRPDLDRDRTVGRFGVLKDLSERPSSWASSTCPTTRSIGRARRRSRSPSLPVRVTGPDYHRNRLRDEVPPSGERRGKDACDGGRRVHPPRRSSSPSSAGPAALRRVSDAGPGYGPLTDLGRQALCRVAGAPRCERGRSAAERGRQVSETEATISEASSTCQSTRFPGCPLQTYWCRAASIRS